LRGELEFDILGLDLLAVRDGGVVTIITGFLESTTGIHIKSTTGIHIVTVESDGR
jgi:hypothetical protein